MSLISFDEDGVEIENFLNDEKTNKSAPVFNKELNQIKSFTLEGGCEAELVSIIYHKK